jgi:hypothetical protein
MYSRTSSRRAESNGTTCLYPCSCLVECVVICVIQCVRGPHPLVQSTPSRAVTSPWNDASRRPSQLVRLSTGRGVSLPLQISRNRDKRASRLQSCLPSSKSDRHLLLRQFNLWIGTPRWALGIPVTDLTCGSGAGKRRVEWSYISTAMDPTKAGKEI